MAILLTHMNFKGGSSKTTLNLNFILEYCEQNPGFKALLIDGDAQGNATNKVAPNLDIKYTIKDALKDNISLDKLIIKNPINELKNFDLVGSNIGMVTLELLLNSAMGKEFQLMNYFNKEENKKILEEYDLVVFDLNPAISVLNVNVFLCCDSIIPILNWGDTDTIIGKNLLINTYDDIKGALRINKNNIRESVITKYQKRENTLIEDWAKEMNKNNEFEKAFNTKMSQSIHYAECLKNRKSITKYLKENKKKTDIKNEIIELINEYKIKKIL